MQYTSFCNEITSGTSLTATIAVNAGDWVLATVTTRSDTTFPADWTILHESTVLSSTYSSQRMAFLCRQYTESGTASITIQQSRSARIYINLIAFSGVSGFTYTQGTELYLNGKVSSVTATRPDEDIVVWGCSSELWITSSPYGTWTCANITDSVICLDPSSTAPRQANFVDENTETMQRVFIPKTTTAYIIDCVTVNQRHEYKTHGDAVYEVDFGGISELEESSVSWNSETPTDTSVSVYAKLDGGQWMPCTNGDDIPCLTVGGEYDEHTLSIKVELDTDDVTATPSVWNLRITAKDASDENYLLVNLGSGNASSIQNAVGAAHVIYDGTGGLSGSGGPVAAFDESFTPSGLVYKGHQNDAEHIELSSISATGTLTAVTYHDSQNGEHIELSNITAVGVLTHVDDT